SPVKQYALEVGISLLQPEKLKNEEFLAELKAWNADLQIVVAFRMLPEVVWDMPRFGTFNLHASLLPQYRGAAPINWAVINGDKETGITTFFLQHEIDTGNVIRQEKVTIEETDNAGIVHDKLMTLGSRLVCETVDQVLKGDLTAIPQNEMAQEAGELRAAPKIFKETCRIDWKQNTDCIYNLIRGMAPYPAAWTELVEEDGKRTMVKIYETAKEHTSTSLPAGTLQSDGKSYLQVATPDGQIKVLSLQIAGKKRMSVDEFLRGFRFSDTMIFE
ncbi:MAG: methionyl-tRNA formyltransferase, partial [Bacteroidales bacterium]